MKHVILSTTQKRAVSNVPASSQRKKCGVIKVRIPEDELENLNRHVARAGVSREEFVRCVLTGAVIMETTPADYRLVLRKLDEIQDALETATQANPQTVVNMQLVSALQGVARTATAILKIMCPRAYVAVPQEELH